MAHAKLINSTQYQTPVTIEDVFGNVDTVLLQPGGRVDLPEGFSCKIAPPRGIYYTPAPIQDSLPG